MYYYAMINGKGIITSTYASAVKLKTSRHLVEISESDMGSIGKMFWACSTDNVQYLNTSESLSKKLNDIDEEISANKADIVAVSSSLNTTIGNVNTLSQNVANVIMEVANKADEDHKHTVDDITGLKSELSGIKSSVSINKADISEAKAEASNAVSGVDRLDTQLASLSNQIGGVEDFVGAVSHELGQLKADYTETKAKTNEALNTVKTRIDDMQNGFLLDLANLTERIDTNGASIAETDARLSGAINDNQRSIANLVTASSNNAIGIQNLEAVNTQQNAEITRINQNVEAVIHTANDHESAINTLEENIDSINDNFTQINANFDGVTEDIAELTEKQGRTDNSINTIWADIRIKEAEMADFKAATAENFGAAQNDINSLDRRVSANAGDIGSLIGSMNNAETKINGIETRLEEIDTTIADVEMATENIAQNTADIASMRSSVEAVNRGLATANTNITAVTNKANTLETKAATLENNVNTAITNINSLTTRTTAAERAIDSAEAEIDSVRALMADYLPKTGGTVDGDLNVGGVLRVSGNQAMFYNAESQNMIIGTGNAKTVTIAGANEGGTTTVNSAMFRPYSVIPRNADCLLGNANFRWKGIYSQASVNVSSDERLKKEIAETDREKLADFIGKLPVKTYKYKDDNLSLDRIGLIAQDVIKADPELSRYFVSAGGDGYYNLKPADLVFPLIAAVQHLQEEVEQLKK